MSVARLFAGLIVVATFIIVATFQNCAPPGAIKGDGSISTNSNEPGAGTVGGIPHSSAPTAVEYRGQIDKVISYTCGPDSRYGAIWGTDIYTDDSNVCTAAKHSSIPMPTETIIYIKMAGGMLHYDGSTRNGVSSLNYAQWSSSYYFVDSAGHPLVPGLKFDQATPTPSPTPVASATPAPTPSGETTGMYNAVAFRGQNGRVLDYSCNPISAAGSIWGTDEYTDDSAVCAAAKHVGVLGADPKVVHIKITPGKTNYVGKTRNGVTSSDWGSWVGSFIFVDASGAQIFGP